MDHSSGAHDGSRTGVSRPKIVFLGEPSDNDLETVIFFRILSREPENVLSYSEDRFEA